MPVRMSLVVLLFPAALILAVQVTGQVPFLEQLILAPNSNFCGSSSSDFMSFFKLDLAMLTLTLLSEAACKVTVALTSLMLVVAFAMIFRSEVLPTFTVAVLGTLSFTRATSPDPVVGCWTALPVRLTAALPPLLEIVIAAPVSVPTTVGA